MILNRLKLLIFAATCVIAPTLGVGAAELPQALIDCRDLGSAVARLDCYDRIVDAHVSSAGQSRAEITSAQAPAAAVTAAVAATAATETTSVPPLEMSEEDLFGKNYAEVHKSVQEATGSKEIDRIESFVTKIKPAADGKAIITLDNGQVWTQIDNSRLRLSSYDKVVIRRASLGSFMLNKDGSKTSMRVRRVL